MTRNPFGDGCHVTAPYPPWRPEGLPQQREESVLEEAALIEEENAIVRREEELAQREHAAEALVSGIEGRCRLLQKKLCNLSRSGVPGVDALIGQLPSVAPRPGTAERAAANDARREAIQRRKAAATGREKSLRFMLGAIDRARDELAGVEGACEHLESQLASQCEQTNRGWLEMTPPSDLKQAFTPPPRVLPPAPPPPGPERRELRRTRLECEVGLATPSNFFTGFARNISSGGLFVAVYDPQPVGTPIDLAFRLPGGPTLTVPSTVCWVRTIDDSDPDVWPGMGLRFDKVTPQIEAAIDEFLDCREPLFFPE